MTTGLSFYSVQISVALVLGAALAFLGVFVVLRRLAMFGVTLSQAATAAVSLALLLGLKGPESSAHSRVMGDLLVLALTGLFMLPFYVAVLKAESDPGALLVLGVVVFAAVSQLLLAFGGRVQNHLVQAFFGNVLTTAPGDLQHVWLPFMVLFGAFALGYRDLVAVSFDRDHARLSGSYTRLVEAMFFLGLSYVASEAINLMGSFYTLAQMVIPALVALSLTKSLPAAIFVAVVYSAIVTTVGFALSLETVRVGSETLNLPTSSTIVLLLAAGLPIAKLSVRLIRRVRRTGRSSAKPSPQSA